MVTSPSGESAPLDYATPVAPQGQWSAVIAGFLGWMLDAFDFFLVTLTLTEIARDFGQPDKRIALSLTLTLAFRPVGALIFGLMADRYGRRLPMIIDLIFYSVIEVCTGFAPNYATFMVLRALFGIGMGGEWGLGATLVMEKVPPKWRGLLSGFLQQGYAAGYLLAAACYWLVPVQRVGWRPLFFIGGLPALLAVFVRFGVKESEVWERSRAPDWQSLTGGIAKNWKLFLYLAVLMVGMNFSSHGTQDMYPTFLKEGHRFSKSKTSAMIAVMQSGAIVGGILFGLLSDKIGRRTAMLTAFAGAIAAIPLWAFSSSVGMLVLGAFIIQFMVQGAWGVIPAHITELSPDNVRGFLPGFAYQCGVLIAGSIAYVQALLSEQMSYGKAMALTALLAFIVAMIAIAAGRERRAVAFGTEETASETLRGFQINVPSDNS